MKNISSKHLATGVIAVSVLVALPLYFASANKPDLAKPGESVIDAKQAAEQLVKETETKAKDSDLSVMMLDDENTAQSSTEIPSTEGDTVFEENIEAASENTAMTDSGQRKRAQTTTNVQRSVNAAQRATSRRPRF